MRIRLIGILLSLSLTPAFAADHLCEFDEAGAEALSVHLVDVWEVDVTAGEISKDGVVVAVPADRVAFTATTFLTEDGLNLTFDTGDIADVVIPLAYESDVNWDLPQLDESYGEPSTSLSDEDLSMVLDCEINTMPRLTGGASFAAGTLATFIFVIGEDLMYGVTHYRGNDGIQLRERMVFSR